MGRFDNAFQTVELPETSPSVDTGVGAGAEGDDVLRPATPGAREASSGALREAPVGEAREAPVEDARVELRLRRGEVLAWLARAALLGTATAELTRALTGEVARALDAERCVFLERITTVDEPDRFAVVAAEPDAADPGWQGLAAYLLKRGRAVVAPDLRREPRFGTAPATLARGVRAVLAVAVCGRAEPAGVLVVESHVPRRFVPDEVELLQSVADLLGLTLERRRQERHSRLWADLLDLVEQAVIVMDLEGRVEFWNAAAARLYGWTADEATGRDIAKLTPTSAPAGQGEEIMAALSRGESWSGELELRRKGGDAFPALVMDSPLRDAAGTIVGIVSISMDITERKALESQLQQSQKMESIGRLAGGVAHDFNNILTTIQGHTALLLEQMPEDDAMREDVDEVRRGAERAATLTRQLLAFSRRQVLRPRILDPGRVVGEMEGMLKRLLGEHIVLESEVQPDAGCVRADRARLEQVVFDLAANARDAMPEGGVLRLQVRRPSATLLADDQLAELGGGDCIMIAMQDSGVGMDAATLANIFEPFFTTKPRGAATGLGLATVYGIVQQSGGQIRAESRPGQGTTFRVYFPRVADDAGAAPAAPAATPRRAQRTVLLVEDEDGVRTLSRRILERSGYRVLEASDGAQALDVAEHAEQPIDLLFTDVVMPRLDGKRLADRLGEMHPRMAVLFTSGYAEDAIVHRGVLDDGLAFLEKPFTPQSLLRKVHQVLDGAGDAAAAGPAD